jgi:hypothetical protein
MPEEPAVTENAIGVAVELRDWLDRDLEASMARQRAQVDTAKLLATFVAGIAATLVATALQVGKPTILDSISVYSLAGATCAAIAVILFDRMTAPNSDLILRQSVDLNWDNNQLIDKLREANCAAVEINRSVVNQVRQALTAQVVISIFAGTLAVISLLSRLT